MDRGPRQTTVLQRFKHKHGTSYARKQGRIQGMRGTGKNRDQPEEAHTDQIYSN